MTSTIKPKQRRQLLKKRRTRTQRRSSSTEASTQPPPSLSDEIITTMTTTTTTTTTTPYIESNNDNDEEEEEVEDNSIITSPPLIISSTIEEQRYFFITLPSQSQEEESSTAARRQTNPTLSSNNDASSALEVQPEEGRYGVSHEISTSIDRTLDKSSSAKYSKAASTERHSVRFANDNDDHYQRNEPINSLPPSLDDSHHHLTLSSKWHRSHQTRLQLCRCRAHDLTSTYNTLSSLLTDIGTFYFSQNKLGLASKWYKRALEHEVDNETVTSLLLNRLGVLSCLRRKKKNDAIDYFSRVLQLRPSLSRNYILMNNIGYLHDGILARKKYDMALSLAERCDDGVEDEGLCCLDVKCSERCRKEVRRRLKRVMEKSVGGTTKRRLLIDWGVVKDDVKVIRGNLEILEEEERRREVLPNTTQNAISNTAQNAISNTTQRTNDDAVPKSRNIVTKPTLCESYPISNQEETCSDQNVDTTQPIQESHPNTTSPPLTTTTISLDKSSNDTFPQQPPQLSPQITSLLSQGHHHLTHSSPSLALPPLLSALSLLTTTTPPPSHLTPFLSSLYTTIGSIHTSLSDYQSAIPCLQSAFAIRRQINPESNKKEDALLLDDIASLQFRCERYEESLRTYRGALALKHSIPTNNKETTYDELMVSVLHTRHLMALVFSQLQDYDQSLEILNEEVLPRLRVMLGDNHERVVKVMLDVGVIEATRGRVEVARRVVEEVLEILGEGGGGVEGEEERYVRQAMRLKDLLEQVEKRGKIKERSSNSGGGGGVLRRISRRLSTGVSERRLFSRG